MKRALYDRAGARMLDRLAIDEAGIPGHVLMDRAGIAIADFVARRFRAAARIAVICGKGNNGGDGYVAARELQRRGYDVNLVTLVDPDSLEGDAQRAFDAWRQAGAETIVRADGAILADIETRDVAIDALLGTGYRGALSPAWRQAIDDVNACAGRGTQVLAVDLPSGVDGDDGTVADTAVRANWTLTMGFEKVGLRLWPGRRYAGEIHVADLGYPANVVERIDARARLLTRDDASCWAPVALDAHKGAQGALAVIGGSGSMPGAAALAARAALRGGCGRVFVCSEAGGHVAVDPEVMRLGGDSPWEQMDDEWLHQACGHVDAWVVGPGLGREEGRLNALAGALARFSGPAVVDADALFALRHLGSRKSKAGLLLTPHLGEAARLLESTATQVQAKRLEAAVTLANRYEGVVVLKGAGSIVTDGRRVAISPVASPALAVPGSGDVLAGIAGALLARGIDPFVAACGAVWVHGATVEHLLPQGNLAREIADAVPLVLAGAQ